MGSSDPSGALFGVPRESPLAPTMPTGGRRAPEASRQKPLALAQRPHQGRRLRPPGLWRSAAPESRVSQERTSDLRELGLPLGPRKIVLKAIRGLAGHLAFSRK